MITTKEQLYNTKIKVNSPEESELIQKRAFKLGFLWSGGKSIILHTNRSYLYFWPDGEFAYSDENEEYFRKDEKREIFLSDLIGEPLKQEYKHTFVVHSENKNLLIAFYEEALKLGRMDDKEWNNTNKNKKNFQYLHIDISGIITFHTHNSNGEERIATLELPTSWDKAIAMLQEKEYIIPDYVRVVKCTNGNSWYKDYIGEVVKVVRKDLKRWFSFSGPCVSGPCVASSDGNHQGGVDPQDCVIATEEEYNQQLKESTILTIGKYTSKYEQDRVSFGCQTFSKEELSVVYRLLCYPVNADISIQGTKITPDMIEKMINGLK